MSMQRGVELSGGGWRDISQALPSAAGSSLWPCQQGSGPLHTFASPTPTALWTPALRITVSCLFPRSGVQEKLHLCFVQLSGLLFGKKPGMFHLSFKNMNSGVSLLSPCPSCVVSDKRLHPSVIDTIQQQHQPPGLCGN